MRHQGLPQMYRVVHPAIHFTHVPFKHSRSVVSVTSASTSNDGLSRACITSSDTNLISICAALCWVADGGWEVLINGQKRGVSPKHRLNAKFRCGLIFCPVLYCLWMLCRPMLSKIALLELACNTLRVLGHPTLPCVCIFTSLTLQ
jgi:hypothetical protein